MTSERRLARPGFELRFLDSGDRGDEALVLLHGWPQHGEMWRPLLGDLGAGRRVLVPDLRGFGLSGAPAGGYDKHTLAADVLALLDAEEIESAAIVGHDWGGWIACLLALEHPDRVRRFVSLDAPPPWASHVSLARLPRQLLFGAYQAVIASPVLGEQLLRRSPRPVRAFIRAGSGPGAGWTDERLDVYARPLRDRARARASVALYRTFLLRELPALARGTYTEHEPRVPGLIAVGERSPITRMLGVPPASENVEVAVIAGAGHYLVEEAPTEVLALTRSFLDRS